MKLVMKVCTNLSGTVIILDRSAFVGQLELTQDFNYTSLKLYIMLSHSLKGLLYILKENVSFYTYKCNYYHNLFTNSPLSILYLRNYS